MTRSNNKISTKAAKHFMDAKPFKLSNTKVEIDDLRVRLYLHNNLIAWRYKNESCIKISSAGWKSNTTKARLNALPCVHIYQKNKVWYLSKSYDSDNKKDFIWENPREWIEIYKREVTEIKIYEAA